VPTLADVLEARRRISPHLRPTPLYGYATLSELLDADVFVKHENHQPVGAFKVRGGVNLISQLNASCSPPIMSTSSTTRMWSPSTSIPAQL
jgi:threonine dehydratase